MINSEESPAVWVFCCRSGMEPHLQEELADRCGGKTWSAGAGLVVGTPGRTPAGPPLVFERQRLPGARHMARNQTRPVGVDLAREWLGPVLRGAGPWTTHAFTTRPESEPDLSRQARGLEQAFLRVCQDSFPEAAARWKDPLEVQGKKAVWVVQFLVGKDGVWSSACRQDALSDPRPGGIHRMRMDAAAPSRSYLKIEEALERSGYDVRTGQQVVDLGAAPGGWSYAFLKRGCRVIGVDRGPMKLPPGLGGRARFQHIREDGMTYAPPLDLRPVDWLVCDMLVPPGKVLGLLRRWIGNRWASRYIVTLKLPQQKPWPVLREFQKVLDREKGFRSCVRQLYHDRQEVTVWGELLF